MNLTIIENKVIAAMPVALQEFVTAKFKPQIFTLKDSDLAVKVSALVIKTLVEAGVKDAQDNKVVTFLRETMIKDLRHPKFAKLTFEEVELAFRNGVRQEYGPFMGVNVQTLHFWIKSFLMSKERELAIKGFYAKSDEQEFGKVDKFSPANPEGQKKLVEMLRPFCETVKPSYEARKFKPVQKSDRDKFIQQCLTDFDELCDKNPSKEVVNGKTRLIPGRYIDYQVTDKIGVDDNGDPILIQQTRPIDVTEFLKIKVTEYDLKQVTNHSPKQI